MTRQNRTLAVIHTCRPGASTPEPWIRYASLNTLTSPATTDTPRPIGRPAETLAVTQPGVPPAGIRWSDSSPGARRSWVLANLIVVSTHGPRLHRCRIPIRPLAGGIRRNGTSAARRLPKLVQPKANAGRRVE